MKKITAIIFFGLFSLFSFTGNIFANENCVEKNYSNLYDGIFYLNNSSDLGVVFVAKKDGEFFVLQNSKIVSDKYLDLIKNLQITPDSKISYVITEDGLEYLIKDSKTISYKYDEILSVKYSPDGEDFAFIASNNSYYFIVENDKIISDKFSDLDSIKYLEYSPEGDIFFIYKKNNKYYLEKDSKVISSKYDKILNVAYSSDGENFAFSVEDDDEYFIVENNKVITEKYNGDSYYIGNLGYSLDDELTYSIKEDGKWHIVKNGKIITDEYDGIGWKYSPDGTLIIVAKENDKWFLIKNNKIISSEYDSISYLDFSEDGQDLAFIGENYGYKYIIKNGEIVSKKYEILNDSDENIEDSIKNLQFLKNGEIIFLVDNYNKNDDRLDKLKLVKKIICGSDSCKNTPTIITSSEELTKNYIITKQKLKKSNYKEYVYDIENLINNTTQERLSELFYKIQEIQKTLKYKTSYKYNDLKVFVNFFEAAVNLKLKDY